MTRKAWIETDQFDLEAIAAHLQSGDITVVREGDGYYLTSPEIDAAADDAQANEIVAKIISRINALGRIHDANFREVKLSRYTDDTGKSVVTGVMGATLQPPRAAMKGSVTDPDGSTGWRAWLEGDQVDLQDLANLLPSGMGDIHVAQEGDAYYLTASAINNPPEGSTFYQAAQTTVDFANGLARVRNPSFQPVRLSGRYTKGEEEHRVISPAPMECRIGMGTPTVTVTKPNGTIVPGPPSPWPGYLALAETNEHVTRVLDIYKRAEPLGWAELFKVHEIMHESIEGSIPKMGWASKADDDAFGPSANRRDVSGEDARHAKQDNRPPPKKTMTIEQGRQYIRDVVAKWLAWLAT